MVPGDGAGKKIELDGSFTVPGCIKECGKKEGVNGITTSEDASNTVEGKCFCELGMGGEIYESTSYKTCYLKVNNLDFFFYLVLDTSTDPFV